MLWNFKSRILQRHRLSAQPVTESMDREHVFFLLSELRQLLEEDDTRAVRTFETLREALPAGMAGDELADLEKHIEGYAFEEALETLGVVEQTLNDSLLKLLMIALEESKMSDNGRINTVLVVDDTPENIDLLGWHLEP